MTTTEGEQLRLDGVHANLAAATAINRTYRDHAEEVITRYIRQGALFTADDIHRLIPEGIEPHSPNVLPSLLAYYSRRKLIRPVGWAASGRASRHASHNRIWRGN
jgi:hypothetical protein